MEHESTRTIHSTLDRDVIAIDTAGSIGFVTAFFVSPAVVRINKVRIGDRRTFKDSNGDIASLTDGSDNFPSAAVHSISSYADIVAR